MPVRLRRASSASRAKDQWSVESGEESPIAFGGQYRFAMPARLRRASSASRADLEAFDLNPRSSGGDCLRWGVSALKSRGGLCVVGCRQEPRERALSRVCSAHEKARIFCHPARRSRHPVSSRGACPDMLLFRDPKRDLVLYIRDLLFGIASRPTPRGRTEVRGDRLEDQDLYALPTSSPLPLASGSPKDGSTILDEGRRTVFLLFPLFQPLASGLRSRSQEHTPRQQEHAATPLREGISDQKRKSD